MKPTPFRRYQHHPMPGFTLVELITALAMAILVLSISIPALSSMLDRNRMSATTNLIVTQLALARSEAIKHRQEILLCPSDDGAGCSGGYHWNHGFILFPDRNHNRRRDEDENILNRFDSLMPEVQVTTTIGRPRILFHPDGSARGYNATLTLCDHRGQGAPRTVILSNSGRVRVSEYDADGHPPSCPTG